MRLRITLTVAALVLSACGNDDGPSIVDSNNDSNNGSNSTENSVNGGTNSEQNSSSTFPGYVDGVACASDGDCAGKCNIDSICEGGGGDGVLPDGESCTGDADCAGTCGDGDVCEGDPMGTNNDSNNANNESFPGYVDGTDCTSDSDCAGTCGGEDTCEGGGGDGVLPDGESCTDDVDCAGTCGGNDTCEGDPYGGEGPNNGTNNNNSTNNNSTNNDTTGPNNDTTGGSGNNVEDAAEGETGGLCPDTCPTPPQVPATTACDGCSEGRCHHTSPFDLYCTRACEGPADCEDLGTDWNCENGSCVL